MRFVFSSVLLLSTVIIANGLEVSVPNNDTSTTSVPERTASQANKDCNCQYQVKFGEDSRTNVYLEGSYEAFGCKSEEDVFECRLLCVYKVMNRNTQLPHAKGLAWLKGDKNKTKVNIVSEACRLQKKDRVTVDVRYQLCNGPNKVFLSFDYCCELEDLLIENFLKKGVHKNAPNSSYYFNTHEHELQQDDFTSQGFPRIWKYTPDQSCLSA